VTDRTRRPHLIQRPVTPMTFFHLRFFASNAVKNKRFTSTKVLNPAELANVPQTHLYRSNFTYFANVPTPTSDHHLVHVC
jgi:hypothetical protein